MKHKEGKLGADLRLAKAVKDLVLPIKHIPRYSSLIPVLIEGDKNRHKMFLRGLHCRPSANKGPFTYMTSSAREEGGDFSNLMCDDVGGI